MVIQHIDPQQGFIGGVTCQKGVALRSKKTQISGGASQVQGCRLFFSRIARLRNAKSSETQLRLATEIQVIEVHHNQNLHSYLSNHNNSASALPQ